jgi:dTDP-4-amino-4,6-dideoxygalactose transaminase
VRTQFLPYCLPLIGEDEIQEVVDSLRSGWLTTGPKVKRFEQDFAEAVGSRHAIAVNSCTAALHLSLAACGIGPGDEVVVPTMTFCATANVVVHLGARPVLADVDANGLMCVGSLQRVITSRTRAIVPVHFAGQACDLDAILSLAAHHNVPVIEDAAHAAGAAYKGKPIGNHGRATAFSFYATKNMTTGEGGMVTTDDDELAALIRRLALHGMSRDAWKRYTEEGSWYYEVLEPGYKDNMTDVQAALGIHQLRRLESFITHRRAIAAQYDHAFAQYDEMELPVELPDRKHVYHVYPIRLRPESGISRAAFISQMKQANIGTSVHFIPLHRHPYYRDSLGCCLEHFPMAEQLYAGYVSLPLYPAMTREDVDDVVHAVQGIVGRARKNRCHVPLSEPDLKAPELRRMESVQ